MQQLYSDIDKAISLLPMDYQDIGSESAIPTKYLDQGGDVDDYNRVFGNIVSLRMTGRIARAVRAKAALQAASPAFGQGCSGSD